MDFTLNGEQQMLRDSVRPFLEKEVAPLDAEYGDREMDRDTAIRLLKMLLPFGYIGDDRAEDQVTRGVLEEELGRVSPSLAGMQFVHGVAASIARSAHPDVAKRLAPGLATCDLIGCLAISEPNVGSDPTSIECRAVRKGDRYVVSGEKTWISNGAIADVAVLFARIIEEDGSERVGQLIVHRDESPFTSRDIPTIGLRGWPLSELHFDDVEVPDVNLFVPDAPSAAAAEQPGRPARRAPNFNAARVMCASVSCGIAWRALEMATEYVQNRTQFGREVGRFQMVQQLIADMAIEVEAARLLTYRARAVMQGDATGLGGPLGTEGQVAVAKAYATEMVVRVTSKAIECMGAMGLTEEARVERLYRDARMWMVPDGTSQIQRLVIAREITGFSAVR